MRSIILSLLSLLFLVSCNSYDENERFDGPLTVNTAKRVLIEDFTGQKCTNCPRAAQRIKDIQAAFGEENVIAVAIYTDGEYEGSWGIHEKDGGLANDEGLALLKEAGVKSFPNGRVDRTGLSSFASWTKKAEERLQLATDADVAIESCTFSSAEGTISADVKVIAGSPLTGAKLEVWITENGIIGSQLLPTGEEPDYEHNHVFRGLMTAPVAVDLTSFPLEQTFSFNKEKKDGWNVANLHIVAILSAPDGTVLTVASKGLDI